MEKPAPRVLIRPPPPGVEAGVDEALIRKVVHAFYERIRADAMLGPIFTAQISDWEPHLEKMCGFWSSVLLMTKRYEGRPVPAHLDLHDSQGESLGGSHFVHWLSLFRETVSEICPGPAADLFVDRAGRIAQSLQLSIDFRHGRLPPIKAPIRSASVPTDES